MKVTDGLQAKLCVSVVAEAKVIARKQSPKSQLSFGCSNQK